MKQLIRDLMPPLVWRSISRLRSRLVNPEWEYMPEGWQAAQTNPAIKGWNVQEVLETYKAKWPAFVKSLNDTTPFGVSPEAISAEPDLAFHNAMMSYAYVLALAARHKSSLSILDWGGGIGHYYMISRALVPGLEIEYHCKDVPVLVEYGHQVVPEAHFYTNDTCLTRQYDFVLASTSLHYSRDWVTTLKGLATATAAYMFVTGLPIIQHSPSYVFVQRPYYYGYNTEYLGWCLNRKQFLQCAEAAGLKLVREFIIGYRPVIYRAPEQNEYRGFLFRSANLSTY